MAHIAERTEREAPFSPLLRRACIRAIECINSSGLELSGSWAGAVRLLHHLNVDAKDVVWKYEWVQLLLTVSRSPGELESLSPHYWHLLDEVLPVTGMRIDSDPREVEVMRSFEEAGDWEKLEIWLPIVWRSLPWDNYALPSKREIVRVTLELLLLRPLALPKLEYLYEAGVHLLTEDKRDQLRRICDETRRAELPLPDSPSR